MRTVMPDCAVTTVFFIVGISELGSVFTGSTQM